MHSLYIDWSWHRGKLPNTTSSKAPSLSPTQLSDLGPQPANLYLLHLDDPGLILRLHLHELAGSGCVGLGIVAGARGSGAAHVVPEPLLPGYIQSCFQVMGLCASPLQLSPQVIYFF